MINIAIFGSGNGSNFQAITDAINNNQLTNCQICFVHTNNLNAKIIARAKKLNIFCHMQELTSTNHHEYDQDLLKLINKYQINLICLAGYMKILSKNFLNSLNKNIKVINIHPSLLPAYPGINSIAKAYNAKEKYLGVSIHYVDEGMDTGTIILQEKVLAASSLEATEKLIHQLEHKLYIQAIIKVVKTL